MDSNALIHAGDMAMVMVSLGYGNSVYQVLLFHATYYNRITIANMQIINLFKTLFDFYCSCNCGHNVPVLLYIKFDSAIN